MFGKRRINKLSNLPYDFLGLYDQNSYLLKNLEEIDNEMSVDYISTSFKLMFMGYPTDMNKDKLVTIELYDNQYNVFGITVGMKSKKIKDIIYKYGFKRAKKLDTNWQDLSGQENTIGYKNGNILICFEIEENVIKEIIIDAKSIYLGLVEY